MLSWFWAIEAFQTLGIPLPVNIRFVLEGMEESGSVGLDDLVDEMAKPSGFLDGIDFMAISDNYWCDVRPMHRPFHVYHRVPKSSPYDSVCCAR